MNLLKEGDQPDMLTGKVPTRWRIPKPISSISCAGSLPRIARCTTATDCRFARKSRPPQKTHGLRGTGGINRS